MPALPRPASGPGSRYTARAATSRFRPARHTDVAVLARLLTTRDQWLTRMLHEHRVLTTHQIAALAYTSLRSTQRRLRTLHQHTVVDSFRPLTQTGSAPEHYTLGPAGAAVLAAHVSCDLADLGWRPSHTGRIAYSPSLGHDLGVNDLLVHLAARARTTPGSGLTVWLSEKSCARRWGDIVRPDAYAHWQDDDRVLPFFLEYDTGSQPLARVEAKLTGYAAFGSTTGTRPALLIHTRTQSRDQAIRRRLAGPVRELGLHVATASADFTTTDPWGPWWSPLQPGDTRRTTLTRLAALWHHLAPADLEPTDADTALTLPVPPLPPATRADA
ncbi:replication-relaxation family protein [Streptomyces sp. PR69]|uniref:replication-relaxation family protein n=1 Tax=Streptomyces sp. PR69 TaxID=2984950 RepID=UPI002264D633|nr:replication-relaxation family protein [Streptomyces sp. PR69]